MKARPKRALPRAGGLARARFELGERLRERRGEIEEGMRARISAIADPGEVADPAYAEGLRSALAAAFDYALDAIERGEERAPAPPPALLAQARLAASSGVSLDTVLRRYLAGYTLLGDFLAHEAEAGGPPIAPAPLLRDLAAILDPLLAVVGAEYEREVESRARSSERRRAERVRRLLAGEPLDTSEIAYDFAGHHTALAADRAATEPIRELATALGARLLLVRRDEATVWAWLGGMRPLDAAELSDLAARRAPAETAIAIGESAEGLAGWRLTHRQAAAALAVAQRGPEPVVHYRDVALLASVLQDELLLTSLRRLYLEPLEGGLGVLQTLRVYLSRMRNVTSTAAALGVTRKTVATRLRAVEQCLGRPIDTCAAELELALCLQEPDARVRSSRTQSG